MKCVILGGCALVALSAGCALVCREPVSALERPPTLTEEVAHVTRRCETGAEDVYVAWCSTSTEDFLWIKHVGRTGEQYVFALADGVVVHAQMHSDRIRPFACSARYYGRAPCSGKTVDACTKVDKLKELLDRQPVPN